MAEKKVALFANVLLGPMYGECYDLLITDSRLLLVYVSKLDTVWKRLERREADFDVYDRESMEVLAARESSLSVPFKDIKKIGMKKALVEEPAWYYLKIKFERPNGKSNKLKVMLPNPPGDQGMREYALEVQTALQKTLPPESAANGSWPF